MLPFSFLFSFWYCCVGLMEQCQIDDDHHSDFFDRPEPSKSILKPSKDQSITTQQIEIPVRILTVTSTITFTEIIVIITHVITGDFTLQPLKTFRSPKNPWKPLKPIATTKKT